MYCSDVSRDREPTAAATIGPVIFSERMAWLTTARAAHPSGPPKASHQDGGVVSRAWKKTIGW